MTPTKALPSGGRSLEKAWLHSKPLKLRYGLRFDMCCIVCMQGDGDLLRAALEKIQSLEAEVQDLRSSSTRTPTPTAAPTPSTYSQG